MRIAIVWLALVACNDRQPPAGPEIAPQPHGLDKPVVAADAKGYIGVLAPRNTNEVRSPISKAAITLRVRTSEKIKKGQALASFDPKQLKQQLDIEKATLSVRGADVNKARGAARSAGAVCEADTKAYKAGVGSKSAMDASCGHYQEAVAEVSSMASSYDAQKKTIDKLKDSITNTTLSAPIDGQVGFIAVHEGDLVDEGHLVMRIDSVENPIVKFAIPGDEATRLKEGDHVDVVIEAHDKPLDGVVSEVQPGIDATAQMIIAQADISSPPADLETGKRCHIRPRKK
jgi:multidrug efflux pump subunit AcrA (membrane-fusion protein)